MVQKKNDRKSVHLVSTDDHGVRCCLLHSEDCGAISGDGVEAGAVDDAEHNNKTVASTEVLISHRT